MYRVPMLKQWQDMHSNNHSIHQLESTVLSSQSTLLFQNPLRYISILNCTIQMGLIWHSLLQKDCRSLIRNLILFYWRRLRWRKMDSISYFRSHLLLSDYKLLSNGVLILVIRVLTLRALFGYIARLIFAKEEQLEAEEVSGESVALSDKLKGVRLKPGDILVVSGISISVNLSWGKQ